MLWDDVDEPSARVATLLRKIKELRSQNLLSINDGFILKLYEHELDQIREKCVHSWGRAILMFNRHRRFCRQCDLEDVTYRHQG